MGSTVLSYYPEMTKTNLKFVSKASEYALGVERGSSWIDGMSSYVLCKCASASV